MTTKTVKTAAAKAPRMSDHAVQAKTGKNWKQWFALLDQAGGKKSSHQDKVRYLSSEHSVGSWWQQMITVAYEQQRGLRDQHQKPDGFQISVSRTVAAPLAALYEAFGNAKQRKLWLPEEGLVERAAIKNKSMRVTWNDRQTSLEISFIPKTDEKSQVVVQHSKLPNATAAAKMKKYWGTALDRLKQLLEGSK